MIVAFCESHNRFEQFTFSKSRVICLNEDLDAVEHHLTTDHAYAHSGPRELCQLASCC